MEGCGWRAGGRLRALTCAYVAAAIQPHQPGRAFSSLCSHNSWPLASLLSGRYALPPVWVSSLPARARHPHFASKERLWGGRSPGTPLGRCQVEGAGVGDLAALPLPGPPERGGTLGRTTQAFRQSAHGALPALMATIYTLMGNCKLHVYPWRRQRRRREGRSSARFS